MSHCFLTILATICFFVLIVKVEKKILKYIMTIFILKDSAVWGSSARLLEMEIVLVQEHFCPPNSKYALVQGTHRHHKSLERDNRTALLSSDSHSNLLTFKIE